MDIVKIVVVCYAIVIAQGRVVLFPLRLVAYSGDSPLFVCIGGAIDIARVEWLVNGSLLTNLRLDNVTLNEVTRKDTQITTGEVLKFIDVSKTSNMTSIQCRTLSTAGESADSEEALLLVQGIPDTVGNLRHRQPKGSRLINLEWTAPFTLSGTEIAYCVDFIYSPNRRTLHSECGSNDTKLSYAIPSTFACRELGVSVTPVNAAGRGTSMTQTVTISNHINDPMAAPELVEAVHLTPTQHMLIMSSPVCHAVSTLESIDTGRDIMLKNLTPAEHNINFITEQLDKNRNYLVMVTASNIAGTATTSGRLSTHDVRTITVTVDSQARLSTAYFKHSTARGVFVFLSLSGSANVSRTAYLALNRETSSDHALPRLSAGEYKVFAYDIETDGTLASGVGYPADSTQLVVTGTTQGAIFQPSYSLLRSCNASLTDAGRLLVMCGYASDASVGFQVIAHQRNLSEARRLHVNKTTNRQTSLSVLVERGRPYQVAIFAIQETSGIVGLNIEHVMNVTDDPETTRTTISSINTILIGLTAGASGVFLIIVVASICVVAYLYLRYKDEQSTLYEDYDSGSSSD